MFKLVLTENYINMNGSVYRHMVVTKQLLNTIYLKQRKDFDDKLMLVVKDSETNTKHVEVITDPKLYWYVTKPDNWLEQPVSQIEIDKCTKKNSLYRSLLKDMSVELGKEGKDFFSKCIKSRQFGRLGELHHEANFHGTDANIEDQYISRFVRKYGQPSAKLSKSFFDIEVDISPSSGWEGGFPDEHEAEAPINAITLYLAEYGICKTYLLRNSANPQIEAFEQDVYPLIDELNKYFKENFDDSHEFEFYFFDDEIDLIASFLDDIHEYKPDFAGAYNMKFDFLTIKNRLENLGYDPEEFFCHPDFPYKYLYYYEDTRHDDIAEKGDYAKVASYTVFKDLMLDFAAIRKGSGKEDSYKLNDICQKYLGIGKYEMDPGITIANFSDKDYKGFVFYNIVDVMLLHYLEKKNEDLDLLYSLSMLTESRLNKALTKTVCLKNYVNTVYNTDGKVLSNNRNIEYGTIKIEKSTTKFRGAFVADPLNNFDGMNINDVASKFLFEYVIDFDYTALYPSEAIACNIEATTQIGRVEFVDTMPINEVTHIETDSSDFFGHLVSKDYINIGNTYFNLELPSDITKDILSGKYTDILDTIES